MSASHLEFLAEEPSMEAFLRALLPRVLPELCTFQVHAFQGKSDLLAKLESRLRGYAAWCPPNWRLVVIVDRDDDNCRILKQRLDAIAHQAGLITRRSGAPQPWQLVNRIAIEELESWFFGDWTAVHLAYPRVPKDISGRAAFRDPDAISGGTWEALERVMCRYGYFPGGLEKIAAARRIGSYFDPKRCRSKSFQIFHQALLEAVA